MVRQQIIKKVIAGTVPIIHWASLRIRKCVKIDLIKAESLRLILKISPELLQLQMTIDRATLTLV